jgi:hypothetical protein
MRARLSNWALDLREQLDGKKHPSVALAKSNLAMACLMQGDLKEARKHYQSALDIRRQVFGYRYPIVARSLDGLSLLAIHENNRPLAWHRQVLESTNPL